VEVEAYIPTAGSAFNRPEKSNDGDVGKGLVSQVTNFHVMILACLWITVIRGSPIVYSLM